jgi:hypothetical protein
MTSGHHIGQHIYGAFPSSQKVLFGSTIVEYHIDVGKKKGRYYLTMTEESFPTCKVVTFIRISPTAESTFLSRVIKVNVVATLFTTLAISLTPELIWMIYHGGEYLPL